METPPRPSKPSDSPAPSTSRVEWEIFFERSTVVRVKGRCMEPHLKEGWKVEVSPCQQITPGDVILLKAKGEYLLHRLLYLFRWKGATYVFHKGDVGILPGLAPKERILGRATAVLEPEGDPIPHRDHTPLPVRRQLLRYRLLCTLYSWIWKSSKILGLKREGRLADAAARFWKVLGGKP